MTICVQTIGKLTSDLQSLEAKLAEVERLKAAADESSAEERYLTNFFTYTRQYYCSYTSDSDLLNSLSHFLKAGERVCSHY